MKVIIAFVVGVLLGTVTVWYLTTHETWVSEHFDPQPNLEQS